MKNQTLLLERTSMSRQSLYSILSNELRRRLETLDDELGQAQTVGVIDKYIQQLVNSEFGWSQIHEIIVSALLGHARREKKRKENKKPRYRSGIESLSDRIEKKLVERYNWFRKKKKINEKENNSGKGYNENREIEKEEKLEKENKGEKEEMPKSILFVQHTENSILAKNIRKLILELKPWTRLAIKVVERAWDRIEDLLHKSNPWEEKDCNRSDCLPCITSSKDENSRYKNCMRRSVIYKTWCKNCRKTNEDRINKEDIGTNKRKIEETIEREDYEYIGETSRSANERGVEHCKDYEHFRLRSHMLKHAVSIHPDIDPSKVEFGMKIVSQHRTAFERQLAEAVLIRRKLGDKLMNSRQEYNCQDK